MSQTRLPRLTAVTKSGSEPFHAGGTEAGFALIDFWRWSASDLVSNTTRGVLAEFIVAKALRLRTDCPRDEWGRCDLLTPSGLKVEVKSAAYIQSWAQKAPSRVSFVVQGHRGWDPETNEMDPEASRHADVYVFALLAHQDKPSIDPLDLTQWQFWAVATAVLDARTRSQHSITVASLTKLAGEAVPFARLAEAVAQADESQHGRHAG